ncbi:protein of unknown function [Tepidibacter aestuarii]|nr:protein of unknown function [Tepidibacter aestuarii]
METIFFSVFFLSSVFLFMLFILIIIFILSFLYLIACMLSFISVFMEKIDETVSIYISVNIYLFLFLYVKIIIIGNKYTINNKILFIKFHLLIFSKYSFIIVL